MWTPTDPEYLAVAARLRQRTSELASAERAEPLEHLNQTSRATRDERARAWALIHIIPRTLITLRNLTKPIEIRRKIAADLFAQYAPFLSRFDLAIIEAILNAPSGDGADESPSAPPRARQPVR